MAEQIYTPVFRLSFPQLWVAKSYQKKPPKFSATLLFSKDTDLSRLKAAAKAAAIEKFGVNLPPNIKSPFRDGAEKANLEGYGPEVIFFSATSGEDRPPLVVDSQGNKVMDRSAFYAGCYCDAIVSPWCYDHGETGNKGVGFNLLAIRKVKDGPSFGGGLADLSLFEELPEGAAEGSAPAASTGDDFLS